MVSALLRGREQLLLGTVSAVSEGHAALALSIGGAPKSYAHTDPNEDAALYVIGSGGSLVAVADGHHGAMGAERALECLQQTWAPGWTDRDPTQDSREAWVESTFDALASANAAIIEAEAEAGLSIGRTTLSLALVRPAEDLLLHASIGDSHLFWERDGRMCDHAWAALRRGGTCFLGREGETRETLAPKALARCETLAGVRSIVLATDGLSERGIGVDDPAAAVARAVDTASSEPESLRALATARGVVHAALDAHRAHRSGDNAASAVLWLA